MLLQDAIKTLKEKTVSPKTRLVALLVIVDHFESEYFALLEEILKDAEDHPDVRSGVALALGKIAGKRPFEILKPFSQDEDVTVRNYVIQALGRTREEAAAPLIIQALKDKNNEIFKSASEALGDLGEKALPYLIDLLANGADDARCVAAWKMGELADKAAIPALTKALQEESNMEVLALCIWALGEIGIYSDEIFNLLIKAKEEPEPYINTRADRAIKKIARHNN